MLVQRVIPLIIAAAALGLLPATVQGDAASDMPDPPLGTIYGTVTQQPCPGSEIPRVECSVPVEGASVILYDSRGRVAARIRTAEDGGYSLMAPPGHYAMKVAQEVVFPHCPDTRVLVSSFVVFRYDVLCESGMRSLDLGSSDPASSGATSKDAYAFGPWWPGDCRFWEVCDGVPPFAVAGEGPCEGGGIESYKYWCRSVA